VYLGRDGIIEESQPNKNAVIAMDSRADTIAGVALQFLMKLITPTDTFPL
jgi:hypothetical protein